MESAAVHSSGVHEVDFRIPPSPFAKRSFFLKPTRPSLPLRKAPPFSPSLSSIVFTTPSVPLVGDRNPQGREDVAGSAIAPPGFWSASGACALKGWLGVLTQQSCECLSASALRNLLIACRFSAFFLVVSIKKRTFAEKFNV